MKRLRSLVPLLSAVLMVGGLMSPTAVATPVWLTSNASWASPDAANAPSPRVVNLRFGHHQNFDRVVIRVRGSLPGGMTHHQRRFAYDGSGKPVPIRGKSGLLVALTPAYAHNNAGNNIYRGPTLARPRLDTLKAFALTGDSEGVVSFGFALTHRAPYRVFTLEKPRRIVIDFQHQR